MWRPQRSEVRAKAANKSQTSAVKRLLQDLKHMREHVVPTVGVVALPLEKDLFTWHCNVRGPKGTLYEGGVFHLVLHFPESYPYDPPSVTVCTTLQHPNVFNGTICLDMLQPGDEQEKYIGWSSAYSVQSVLIQLQAFLFEESPTIRAEDCRKAVEAANNYTCTSCKHRPLRSWPAFPSYETDAFVLTKSETQIIKDELLCFHSKRTFQEDCLGFGISYHKNIKTGDIQDISSPLDLLGVRAFMREGIRKSSINEPFTHWLPVYLDDEHGKKAFHLAQRSISMICAGNTNEFKPRMALSVFPKLMNTMILHIMRGQIHASVKALEGYCAFHQMFLKFLETYPELLQECRDLVHGFLKSEEGRHKDKVDSLGEFMCYLTVTPEVQWKDIAALLINEQADRQVMWIIKDYPHLGTDQEDPAVDKIRANVSFEASIMGVRHILFHYYFMEHVARPLGASIADMSTNYARSFGRPTNKMVENMQQAFREIKKVKSHNDYFSRIGLPVVGEEDLVAWLRRSVTNSKRRGYHGVEGPKVPSAKELAEESIKSVVPLETLCVKDEKTGAMKLHENEDQWRELCNTRWGFNSLPANYTAGWRTFYLQNNLQDLVSSLSEYPDFKHFYATLDLSSDGLTLLELSLFSPKQLKSGFHWLTALLSRLPKLQSLKIARGPDAGLGIKGVRALVKGLKNSKAPLTSLDLSYSGITWDCCEVLAEGILASRHLQRLSLEGNAIYQQGAKALSRVLWDHEGLTHLNLSNCNMDDAGAKELADGLLANKRLTNLDLSRNSLCYSGLRAVLYNLAFSPSLTELNLSRVSGSGSSAELQELGEALSKLFRINVTLSRLNFWETNIAGAFTASVFESLRANRALRHLDISQIGTINSDQLGHLGAALTKNKTLASLLLENNNITGHGLETLYLHLLVEKEEAKGQQPVDDERARKEKRRNEMLDKVKEVEKEFHLNLVEFNLKNNSLGAHAGKVLGKLVTVATSLEVLTLDSCQLDAKAGETLGLALETNTRLRTLTLRNNNLGKEGAKALATGLRQNKTLQVLDLSGNGIGVSGARAIAVTLAANESLTELNLFGNLVDVDGARELANALAANKTLVKLDLGLNRIRDKGAQAIAQAMASASQLTEIGLKLNFIKDNGAVAVAKAVAASPSIRSLKLAGNQLEDATLMVISDLLKSPHISFDLAPRVALLDPERVARSVWVTPLAARVKKESVRKLFYDAHCGVVLNVSIQDHKTKSSPAKARYAFVEFAHINSVTLALDLSASGKAKVDGAKVRIYRVGTQNKTSQTEASAKPAANQREPTPAAGRTRFGGRGGGRFASRGTRGGRGGGRGGGRVAVGTVDKVMVEAAVVEKKKEKQAGLELESPEAWPTLAQGSLRAQAGGIRERGPPAVTEATKRRISSNKDSLWYREERQKASKLHDPMDKMLFELRLQEVVEETRIGTAPESVYEAFFATPLMRAVEVPEPAGWDTTWEPVEVSTEWA